MWGFIWGKKEDKVRRKCNLKGAGLSLQLTVYVKPFSSYPSMIQLGLASSSARASPAALQVSVGCFLSSACACLFVCCRFLPWTRGCSGVPAAAALCWNVERIHCYNASTDLPCKLRGRCWEVSEPSRGQEGAWEQLPHWAQVCCEKWLCLLQGKRLLPFLPPAQSSVSLGCLQLISEAVKSSNRSSRCRGSCMSQMPIVARWVSISTECFTVTVCPGILEKRLISGCRIYWVRDSRCDKMLLLALDYWKSKIISAIQKD